MPKFVQNYTFSSILKYFSKTLKKTSRVGVPLNTELFYFQIGLSQHSFHISLLMRQKALQKGGKLHLRKLQVLSLVQT